MRITKIVIHNSDSKIGNAETIHEWHLDRGWDGIGYHYVINTDGSEERGRPEYWSGAHVKAYNKDSDSFLLSKKNESEKQADSAR